MATKKKNPQDATTRNTRASNKRHKALELRVLKLEALVAQLLAIHPDVSTPEITVPKS